MMDIKSSKANWFILLALTCLSFGLAESGISGKATVFIVLMATWMKGTIVIDRFMALRHVAGPWRFIVLGWLFLVLGIIFISFSQF